MEASFLFALSALTEWRGLMTLMSSSLTTQRHTNPSMVLFCVCIFFIRTNIDIQELTRRLQRKGCDLSIKDIQGNTAQDIADNLGHN